MEDCNYENEGSKQSRNYGLTGGVSTAVNSLLNEKAEALIIDGLTKDTIKQLKKYAKDGFCNEGNLIEVMCCEGGCIGGNATIAGEKTAKRIINSLLDLSKDLTKE
jgi:iron only hydrogenase large subunit-like protein